MKTNAGEAKEIGKENAAYKEGEGAKIAGEDKSDDRADSIKAIASGVLVSGDADLPMHDDSNVGTPTLMGKGKQKENDGGMISPESLEAT